MKLLHVLAITTSFLVACTNKVLGTDDSIQLFSSPTTIEANPGASLCFNQTLFILMNSLDYAPLDFPPPKEWKKVKGDVIELSYKQLNQTAIDLYQDLCEDLGGTISYIRIPQCFPVGLSRISKLIIKKFPVYRPRSCSLKEISKVYKGPGGLLRGFFGKCSKQRGKDKFVFKIDKKNKKLLKKTCRQLAHKSKKDKERICLDKKYQLYTRKGGLPASRVCRQSCKTYLPSICVEENPRALFQYGPKPFVNSCRWLSQQDPGDIEMTCEYRNPMAKEKQGDATKLGYAYEVCPDTCQSCNSTSFFWTHEMSKSTTANNRKKWRPCTNAVLNRGLLLNVIILTCLWNSFFILHDIVYQYV